MVRKHLSDITDNLDITKTGVTNLKKDFLNKTKPCQLKGVYVYQYEIAKLCFTLSETSLWQWAPVTDEPLFMK